MQPDIPAAKDQTIDSLDELLAARRALVKDRTAALNRAKTRTLGPPTVLALLVDMPELGSMNAKQSGSLAGLAPVTRQSGHWSGKSYIQGGRANLRHALYMPTLVAIRFDPPLRAKYLALRAAGKPAKVAIVAITRKLLIIANALLRDNCKWTPEMA
jgi:transposase